jgi:hypothetical protein
MNRLAMAAAGAFGAAALAIVVATTIHAADELPAARPKAVPTGNAVALLDNQDQRDWIPPDKPDPDSILQEARSDARAGRYEIALAKYVWTQGNAIRDGESISASTLSDWKSLGRDYPPALEKLREIRDHLAAQTMQGLDIDRGFQHLAAINQAIDEESRTTDTFKTLVAKNPRAASNAFVFARRSLVKDKEYALYVKYVDAKRDYLQTKHLYELHKLDAEDPQRDPRLPDFGTKSFRNSTATLVAILSVNHRRLEAAEIATLAKKELEDVDFHKELEAALAGTVPAPWP